MLSWTGVACDRIASMRSLGEFFWTMVATVFSIGRLPVAPGTFGTLAALAVVWVAEPGTAALAVASVLGFLAGTVASDAVEKRSETRDPGCIVIDEVVGYLVAVIGLPLTWPYLLAAFSLFRFFDILKPCPIRNVERRVKGGLGIMLDDLLAGLLTNAVLQAWRLF